LDRIELDRGCGYIGGSGMRRGANIKTWKKSPRKGRGAVGAGVVGCSDRGFLWWV